MTTFDRYAAGKIAEHESRKCARCDSAVDVLFAVFLGVIGALAVAHFFGVLLP